ncbi:MAG: hypothetical protein Q7K44_02860 [Candidatus Liptonbacteria bacterium]|nr:hypothetical protein [Candidatus Liptonbacteria bacterium]
MERYICKTPPTYVGGVLVIHIILFLALDMVLSPSIMRISMMKLNKIYRKQAAFCSSGDRVPADRDFAPEGRPDEP